MLQNIFSLLKRHYVNVISTWPQHHLKQEYSSAEFFKVLGFSFIKTKMAGDKHKVAERLMINFIRSNQKILFLIY